MEALFIIVALIMAFTGLAMLFWGLGQRFLSKQKKKGAVCKIITGILLGAATITLINFYWAITSTSLEGINITDVAIYGAATAVLLVMAFLLMRTMYLPWRRANNERMKQEEATRAEAARIQLVEKFYEECISAGIETLHSESKRQKACLIAQKYYKEFDIDALMEEGKRIREEKLEKDVAATRKAVEDSERKAHSNLVKYANLRGRDKYLRMLDDERRECAAKLNMLEEKINGPVKNADAFMKKEKSWGLAGGIAEGIAGPAAGVAAAIGVQKENANIRQQNEDMAHALGALRFQLRLTYGPEISRLESKLDELKKAYEDGRTLLVEEGSPDTYFRYLKFSPAEVVVSETGTATVNTTVSTEPFDILGDTPAVVDGVVTAHILDGNKEVGQAVMVLPLAGTICSTKLTGMALFCCEPEKKYHVSFAPKDLWGIEKPRM